MCETVAAFVPIGADVAVVSIDLSSPVILLYHLPRWVLVHET